MGSINTSLVAVLPVASLLFVGTYILGGLVLRDFALAQGRFSALARKNPERAEELLALIQSDVDERRKVYEDLAAPSTH